ncbi:hypothetical protein CEP53_005555 [Fusarium sp. AF-6]|nr:hypothetical protein CEP53_005555 [Fusarium sp. AF-6]
MKDWPELSEAMAPEELNGWEIRDVVRIAQASALGEDSPIIMSHLQDALDVVKTFKEKFQEGHNASERPSALRNRKRRRREIDGSYSEEGD